jgi:hypothetical protein
MMEASQITLRIDVANELSEISEIMERSVKFGHIPPVMASYAERLRQLAATMHALEATSLPKMLPF